MTHELWPDGSQKTRREKALLAAGGTVSTQNFVEGLREGFAWGALVGVLVGVLASAVVQWVLR